MAALDYAFVADFAKVEANGTLTAVGVSWTFLQVSELPAVHRMAVAGRVRGKVNEDPVSLRIDLRSPGDSFRLTAEAELVQGANARPYGDGFLGHLFALDLQVPLPAEGLYLIDIHIDGSQARRLVFEVIRAHEEA